jgi:hypothetical protein
MGPEGTQRGLSLDALGERLLGLAKTLLGGTGTAGLGLTLMAGVGFIVANVSLLRLYVEGMMPCNPVVANG